MLDEHAARGQTLRASRANVILALDLDQVRAQDARVEADVEDREDEPGNDQVLEPQNRVLGQRGVAERRYPAE